MGDLLRFTEARGEEGPASAFVGGPSSSSIATGPLRDPPACLCARSLLAVADARLGNGSSSTAPNLAFFACGFLAVLFWTLPKSVLAPGC